MKDNVSVDAEHAKSQEADQAKAILTTLLAAYDESVVDNALFQQMASAAVQAALSGSTANEVFKCMLEIPDAHPGMAEACRLTLNAFCLERPRELRRQPMVTLMTAVRKASTTTVAFIMGLDPDVAVLHPNDETWLTSPKVDKADGVTPCYCHAACCALVGIILAEEVADVGGSEATDLDPDLYDGAHRALSTLKDFLGNDIDINNLRAFAQYLARWVGEEAGFRELTEALKEKQSLNNQDIKSLLNRNGLNAASLFFRHRSWPDADIELVDALKLPADDPLLDILVAKKQLDFYDAPLLPISS